PGSPGHRQLKHNTAGPAVGEAAYVGTTNGNGAGRPSWPCGTGDLAGPKRSLSTSASLRKRPECCVRRSARMEQADVRSHTIDRWSDACKKCSGHCSVTSAL